MAVNNPYDPNENRSTPSGEESAPRDSSGYPSGVQGNWQGSGWQGSGWNQPPQEQQPYSPYRGGYGTFTPPMPPKPPRKNSSRNSSAGKTALKMVGAVALVATVSVGSTLGVLQYTGNLSGRGTAQPGSSYNGSGGVSPNPTSTNMFSGQEMTLPQVAAGMEDSVVGIVATLPNGEGSGSGFIYSSDGLIVTNCHVVQGADQILVSMADGQEYEAKIIGSDEESDLAVIKIDATGLTPVTINGTDPVSVGETVLAIGNPLGLELQGSVTAGIVSAVDRELIVGERSMKLIQTDAAISPGNSGGPLVNTRGQVVGVNSAKIATGLSEGLGFSIPMTTAMPIVSDLIEYGYVTGRPVIGISGGDVSQEMIFFYRMPEGVYVQTVNPGSSAEVAGLQTGDIITGADGSPITSMNELNKIKEAHTPGESMELTVYRGGKTFTASVTLSEYTGAD